MNTHEQRKMNVAVAQDILSVLLTKVKVTTGEYVNYLGPDHSYSRAFRTPFCGISGEHLQANIPTIAKDCQVCAKGAMILARIHLFDGVRDLPENNDSYAEVFGDTGDSIEAAFEVWFAHGNVGNTPDERKFGLQFPDAKARLKAIMQNVVVNGGEFVPTDLKNQGPWGKKLVGKAVIKLNKEVFRG